MIDITITIKGSPKKGKSHVIANLAMNLQRYGAFVSIEDEEFQGCINGEWIEKTDTERLKKVMSGKTICIKEEMKNRGAS